MHLREIQGIIWLVIQQDLGGCGGELLDDRHNTSDRTGRAYHRQATRAVESERSFSVARPCRSCFGRRSNSMHQRMDVEE